MMNEFDMAVPPDVSPTPSLEDDEGTARLVKELLGEDYEEEQVLPSGSVVEVAGSGSVGGDEVRGLQTTEEGEQREGEDEQLASLESVTEVSPAPVTEVDVGNTWNDDAFQDTLLEIPVDKHMSVDNYEYLEDVCYSIESNQMISKAEADILNDLTKGHLYSVVNRNSYTNLPSKTNLKASMEAMDFFKYGAMAIGAAAVGYAALRILKNQSQRAASPAAAQDINIITTRGDLKSKSQLEYDRKIKRLSSHIASGVIRNRKLLDRIQENAVERIRHVNTDVGKKPYEFGKEIVNGIWENKVRTVWSRAHILTVQSNSFSQTIVNLTKAYITTAEMLHQGYRAFKTDIRNKPDEMLNVEDYLPEWSIFESIAGELEGTPYQRNESTVRDYAIECRNKLREIRRPAPELAIPDIAKCVNVHCDVTVMNSLDRSVYNTTVKIDVLLSDIARYTNDVMEPGEIKNNRIKINAELELSVRTLFNIYDELLSYRQLVSSLVTKIRSSYNEASNMWNSIDRDQSGRL